MRRACDSSECNRRQRVQSTDRQLLRQAGVSRPSQVIWITFDLRTASTVNILLSLRTASATFCTVSSSAAVEVPTADCASVELGEPDDVALVGSGGVHATRPRTTSGPISLATCSSKNRLRRISITELSSFSRDCWTVKIGVEASVAVGSSNMFSRPKRSKSSPSDR